MLTALANRGIAAPKRVLGVAGIVLVLAAVFGAPVASKLGSGGFVNPGAASTKASNLLADRFHTGYPQLVLELSSSAGAGSTAEKQVGLHAVATLRRDRYVHNVASYWTVPKEVAPTLLSKDGKSALVVAWIAGNDNDAPKRAAAVTDSLTGVHDGVTVKAGGIDTVYNEVNHYVKSDLTRSEMIAIPLTVVALMWVFGSIVASLLPVAVGLASIIGTMAILRLMAMFTSVSIYSLNMTTAMGLALAIDYSLFIISRYREEAQAGLAPDDALRRTMQTAGRTVLFSALTVGLSLAAMLAFPLYFLRSFAYAGIAVVGFAAIAALAILPAVITLLGDRLDALDLRAALRRMRHKPAAEPVAVEATFWYRFAQATMRRAVPVTLIVVAGLVVLGLPFTHVKFGFPDQRVLPSSASAYQVGQDVESHFPTGSFGTINVVVPQLGPDESRLAGYAQRLSQAPGVSAVESSAGQYVDGRRVAAGSPSMLAGGSTYLVLHDAADPQSAAAKATLAAVKAVPSPWPVWYGGQTAENQDSLHAISAPLPFVLGLIALATFILLFLFTGSLLMPVKALVLNTLSLTATFGAMVWVFQEGHLGWAYPNLTTTGYLTSTMPPLMFCVAFGLSMDYEIFLLSRIREEWLASGRTAEDNRHAVAVGLGRTGRIVTAAALLMAIVFAAISRAHVAFMMLFGTGLTLAVLMDATIVRGTLVPAFMRLAGRWNWWAPAPLARLHARFGLSDEAVPPAPAPEPVAVG